MRRGWSHFLVVHLLLKKIVDRGFYFKFITKCDKCYYIWIFQSPVSDRSLQSTVWFFLASCSFCSTLYHCFGIHHADQQTITLLVLFDIAQFVLFILSWFLKYITTNNDYSVLRHHYGLKVLYIINSTLLARTIMILKCFEINALIILRSFAFCTKLPTILWPSQTDASHSPAFDRWLYLPMSS